MTVLLEGGKIDEDERGWHIQHVLKRLFIKTIFSLGLNRA
jgi:hypothetical protein